jgi:hypothetical protein
MTHVRDARNHTEQQIATTQIPKHSTAQTAQAKAQKDMEWQTETAQHSSRKKRNSKSESQRISTSSSHLRNHKHGDY